MKQRRKASRRHSGWQVVTLCISAALVLVFLGMVISSMILARNLTSFVKENLTVTVLLADSVQDSEMEHIKARLEEREYTKTVAYISKEQAQQEQTEAMGSDPSEFLGFNPFSASFEVLLHADYACRDSLEWISGELKAQPQFTDVIYQEDLMDKVNVNLNKFNLVMIVMAILLTVISFSLIRNNVIMNVHSHRMTIYTMKLVGASWSFIRAPFMRRAMAIGLVAGVVADVMLCLMQIALADYEPSLRLIFSKNDMALTSGALVVIGVMMMTFCTYISVNRFLKMRAKDMYSK